MKIYEVDFEPMYPVPHCLVIAAETVEDALRIAIETVTHVDYDRYGVAVDVDKYGNHRLKRLKVREVDISKPCVVKYESGNY